MSQWQERIKLEQDLTFYSLSQLEIPLHLTELLLLIDDEAHEALCRLSFTIDFPTYQHITARQLFHLFPLTYANDGSTDDSQFTPDQPIELTACLHRDLLIAAAEHELAIEPIAQAMFDLSRSAETNPYRSTEGWLLQSVQQQVSLPEDIADSGTLKAGYTTVWNKTHFS